MLTWDENKRQSNLKKHGIDFADLEHVFDFEMYTEDDASVAYGEQRLRSYCYYRSRVVVLIWIERTASAHIISCRYGQKHEARIYSEIFPFYFN